MLFDVRRRVQHVMMIVSKDADIQEAERVGEKIDEKAAKSVSDSTLISSTMIVMMMAITPSVNASRRPFPMARCFPNR